MNALLKPFLPYLIGIPILFGLGWTLHHKGYTAGQAERTAYYAPILTAAKDIALAANARLKRQETDSAASLAAQEKTRAETEATLKVRADAAERAYARILSQRPSGSHPGPSTPASGTPAEPSGGAGESERIGADAALARTIAERAVRDAQRYQECQRFYNAQRDISNR